jgi:SAM-dependent methyltransferase
MPAKGSGSVTQMSTTLFLEGDDDWRELTGVIRDLFATLDTRAYGESRILPQPGGPTALPLDPANLVHSLKGASNLFHPSAMPWLYRAWLGRRHPHAVLLHDVFLAGRPAERARVEELLSAELARELEEIGVLESVEGALRSTVTITPFDGRLYLSDATRLQQHPDYVYVGRTTLALPEAVLSDLGRTRRFGGRLLDVGCGGGLPTLALASLFDEVVGTDIVERALRYGRLNAAVNGIENAHFRYSDLYSQVDGTFDVTIANPPCVWVESGVGATYESGGGDYGSELPARVLEGALSRLNPGGVVYATLSAPVIDGNHYAEEVLERACSGCEVTLYPMIEEYEYFRSREYRRHKVAKVVRYLAVVRPAQTFSLRRGRADALRLLGYRTRLLAPRLAAAVTRGPRA